MKQKIIRIGTRGSKMARFQATLIKNLLQPLVPNTSIEITIIKTQGDKDMNPVPLDSIGKGWFTKEIDRQLLEGQIDIAVHSLKDLPEILPEGLTIAAIPERDDPREALVSRNNLKLNQLPQGARIGTDSTRRKSQLLNIRDDLIVQSVRGNVNTRLEKLDNGDYDALILAVAGLKRIEEEKRITQIFDASAVIPSPGQGALAIVSRGNNSVLNKLLSQLNHEPSVTAVTIERAFSKAMGGGCKMPVGAYAICEENKITLHGMIGSLDGKRIAKETLSGNREQTDVLAKKLANHFLKNETWYQRDVLPTYIIVTRPSAKDDTFINQLKKHAIPFVLAPSITITDNASDPEVTKVLNNVESFDWVVFTSSNGVRYFAEAIKRINKKIVQKTTFAAVGSETAKEAEKENLPISFVPSRFTTEDLARELPDVRGKQILLPRSSIANPELQKHLKNRGAIVVNIPMYKTTYATEEQTKIEELVQNNQIRCITFTSPSTVKGFIATMQTTKIKEKIFSIPVLSIGSVTTKAAKQYGFQTIITSDIFTTEGMLKKLIENIL